MAKARRRQVSTDATAPALGFLYQCRFGLLLALRQDDPDALVSIEKVDDVAFSWDVPDGRHRHFDLRQLKHHLNRSGGLGDRSLDVWKSLRIWCEAVLSKRIDLRHANLFLVTTSVATSRHAVRYLLPERSRRNPDKAQGSLEAAGATSNSAKVAEAHATLMQLSRQQRRQLFESTYLIDGSENIQELRNSIENHVRLVTDPAHRKAFTDRLEGWWLSSVVDHLMDEGSAGIRVQLIEDQIHELREEFRRGNLPDDFLEADVPSSEKLESDARTFVRQLELICASTSRVQAAQEDHYRAFEQRSSWLREHLLGIDELPRLETRLLGEWKRKFDIMLESIEDSADEQTLVQSGQSLYEWVEMTAPTDPALFVRPEFRSKYMTRGSYHMLSDKSRAGWHPQFDRRLVGDSEDSDAEQLG